MAHSAELVSIGITSGLSPASTMTAAIFPPECVRDVAKRRTFAIVFHPAARKTTPPEKLLLLGGAIQMSVR